MRKYDSSVPGFPGARFPILPDQPLRNQYIIAMELNHNPFRYGADFGPEHLVGRKDEIACVESVIRNGMRLFLIGPRGFGKT